MDNGKFDPAMSPEDVRRRLLGAGFCPTPCVGKVPILKGWPKLHDPTLHEIEQWSRTAQAATNTGILTQTTPTLDIDVLDPEAAAAVEALAQERFEERGYILVRFGKPPKRLVPFRTDSPFPKIKVLFGELGTPEKDCEKLEFLCDGQQFIAHGVHPDTGKPYSWYGGEPGEIKREDLPYIHPEEAQALVDDAVRLLVDQFGYRVLPKRSQPTPGNGADGEPWSLTPDDLMNHDHLAALAMRFVKSGMSAGAVVNFLRDAVAGLANVDEEKRRRRLAEIPRLVSSAQAKLEGGGAQINRVAARATLVLLGDLKMTPINWVWEGWLASGAIHLIAGVPEAGKTSIALKIAATVSSGDRWPDGAKATPGHVLIWTGEDDPERTIKPRLVQMGADVTKISIVKGTRDEDGKLRPFNPSTDLPALALAANDIPGGIVMLIVDPIASVVGGKVDNSNNAGHREKLQPLVNFAEDFNCAIVGVTHFTKGTIGKNPIDRVTGSLAFGAVARVVLVATQTKSGDPERMFIMAKNNLGPRHGAFGYSIIGAALMERPEITASYVLWGEHLEGTPLDLLAEAEDSGKNDEAKTASAQAFLSAALADGERHQKDIAAEGAALGFSSNRLFRASNTMGVVKRREGFGGAGGWIWRLP